jgi:hypothetical protein
MEIDKPQMTFRDSLPEDEGYPDDDIATLVPRSS